MENLRMRVSSALFSVTLAASLGAQSSFVNWESPHVSPLALTPGGERLLAVNTADDRLEVFDASGASLVALPSIPVGLDPVSVRARTNTEAWVVNHVSDSVSIVDLPTGRVLATLETDDEPCDVVFAGAPERAFVSCSQANSVLVFDPLDLEAPPVRIPIEAEDPRALAVSPLCDRVYVAVFESGNGSTILGGGQDESVGNLGFPPNVVNEPASPYAGANPPPNDGASFSPPQNPGNPTPPRVGMIVKQDGAGQWMDDNGGDWSALVSGPQASLSGRPVGWQLHDRDLAVIEVNDLSVSYVDRLMNVNMALGVNPVSGAVAVVGTDATNEVRFEPVLKGVFLRVQLALVSEGATTGSVVDLNDHLDYSAPSVPQPQRDLSIGDPRGVAWNAAGTRAFVTGMGSNNLVIVDASGSRAGLAPTVELGEGPTGVVLQEDQGRAFVLNKFESSVSEVDLTTELEVSRTAFPTAEPTALRAGRKHLYDTHRNSGLGHIACASCHVDARMDRLSWDLGDPAGDVKALGEQNLSAGLPGLGGGFEDWHPMKGPMLTQTLQDIIGKEPHHWRGDRDGLEEFSGAFVGLQGDDAEPSAADMQEFEDFVATLHFPPNPFRNFDNSLPSDLPLPGHYTTGRFAPAGQPLPDGDAQRGLDLYRAPNLLDGGAIPCAICHTMPTGIGTDYELQVFSLVPIPPGPNGERHHALVSVDGSTNVSMKVPQLRNLHERTGFNTTQLASTAGFGFLHDGSVDSIERFLSEPIFTPAGVQDVADLTAFMLAFSGSDLPDGDVGNILEPPGTASQDAHAAVGAQVSVRDEGTADAATLARFADMRGLADAGAVGLVARIAVNGEARGYVYDGGDSWQSDRSAEVATTAQILALAAPGQELTATVVALGTQDRIGIDRDEDGFFDRDELDAASDPDDPLVVPGACALAPPAPVGSLVATAAQPDAIALAWADGQDETEYLLERALAGTGSFGFLARVPADTAHFTDIGVGCGVAYDYRVVARNCAGDSAPTTLVNQVTACASLVADADKLSVFGGGSQVWSLDAGQEHAGDFYLILGSLSGTQPGVDLVSAVVPLNVDGYFMFTLQNANTGPLVDTLGVLSGAGLATARFELPAGSDPALAGIRADHAYVVFDQVTTQPVFASNAVELLVIP